MVRLLSESIVKIEKMYDLYILIIVQLFLTTACKNSLFMSNTFLIYFLKFELKTFRILNLLNDFGAFLCCFPNYLLLMVPKAET